MKKTYLIGNAHIDPVWLWRWQEGFSEIRATFRSALDRMNDYPDFRFTSACAVYYEWIEKVDPEMFAEIRQRVKEGRWNIVGGWFLQPDCNIPSGESLARHSLISQRYFKEKFGITAKTGYNVDSFGHNASIPMILRQSGMKNYVFMRPGPHENADLDDLFIWESPDGSSVRAYRIPHCYCITNMDQLDDVIARSTAEKPLMAFYGVGNHGGGPTVMLINEINANHKPEGVFYSTPDEYFEDTKNNDVKVVKDELQHHARGCYSALSYVKRSNRAAEYALYEAEALSVLADRLTGEDNYPSEKLKKAWKNVLFNQFHDIMGGCAIKSAYKDASYLYGEAMSIAEQASNTAMTRIALNVDTLHDETMPTAKINWRLWSCGKLGAPVFVFNPHAWDVEAVVEITSLASKITDDEGNEVAIQKVRAEFTNGGEKYGTAFMAKVPALGYKLYRIFTEGEPTVKNAVGVTENSLENDLVKVVFSGKTGEISGFVDKRTGEDILSGETGTVLLDETNCDTWAHDKVYLGEDAGSFGEPVFSIIEEADVRSTLRVETRFGSSALRRDYTLEKDSDEIKVKLTVDFHEKHRAFKLTIPAGDKVISSIPFGSIERPLGTGEEPCAEWLATGNIGYASDITYGYDMTDKLMRPTIFRSCIINDHFGARDEFCEYMEQGVSTFRYTLFPFTTRADAKRRADEFNLAPKPLHDTYHKGTLADEFRGFEADSDNIVVTAVKRGEDGGKVLRFVELDGKDAKVGVGLFGEKTEIGTKAHEVHTIADGREVDLIEW